MVFALWTMRELGGGRLIVSDYHKGNWSLDIARTMQTFLEYQPYVESVEFMPWGRFGENTIDYDLQQAEHDYNPRAFPEWDRKPWPSNCNIAKRYATHFGLTFRPGDTWIDAPQTPAMVDVAMHIPPHRLMRSENGWKYIHDALEKNYRVATLQGGTTLYKDSAMQSAIWINSAKCFLGCVSSCNAIAEGLGKRRLVEHAEDCWNVTPDVVLNGLSNDEIVQKVREICA